MNRASASASCCAIPRAYGPKAAPTNGGMTQVNHGSRPVKGVNGRSAFNRHGSPSGDLMLPIKKHARAFSAADISSATTPPNEAPPTQQSHATRVRGKRLVTLGLEPIGRDQLRQSRPQRRKHPRVGPHAGQQDQRFGLGHHFTSINSTNPTSMY
jgi:hypothetical protein